MAVAPKSAAWARAAEQRYQAFCPGCAAAFTEAREASKVSATSLVSCRARARKVRLSRGP